MGQKISNIYKNRIIRLTLLRQCPILYPLKTKGFLTFSEGIEIENWHEKGKSLISTDQSISTQRK